MSSVFPCSGLLLHQFVTYPASYRTAGAAVTLCGGGSDAASGGRQAGRDDERWRLGGDGRVTVTAGLGGGGPAGAERRHDDHRARGGRRGRAGGAGGNTRGPLLLPGRRGRPRSAAGGGPSVGRGTAAGAGVGRGSRGGGSGGGSGATAVIALLRYETAIPLRSHRWVFPLIAYGALILTGAAGAAGARRSARPGWRWRTGSTGRPRC